MPENNNYEVENQTTEEVTETADDNRDLMLLAGGAALAGAGAYALVTKGLIPAAKKVGGWLKDHSPFKKKMVDTDEVPKAEEPTKKN